jgi:hypothetical protein
MALVGLDHRATFERATPVKNTHGEEKPDWYVTADDVPCHLAEKAVRSTGTDFGAPAYLAAYQMLVGLEADVLENDRVSNIRRGELIIEERAFTVTSVLKKRSPLGLHHKTLLLDLVKRTAI